MSVRKRTYADGSEVWQVDYKDQFGRRRSETFTRKKDADRRSSDISVEVRTGMHTAHGDSVTVAKAAQNWLDTARQNELEETSIQYYQIHVDRHIVPVIGHLKLSKLTVPVLRQFETQLLDTGRSMHTVRAVRVSLGGILGEAQEAGLVNRNVVAELRVQRKRKRGADRRLERRHKGKLKVGVDIPTPAEVRAFLQAAKGKWRALFTLAAFTGLRASELRGLRWSDINFAKSLLHVHQRADQANRIGVPKSEAGERTVPIPSNVLAIVREWRLACPKGRLDLVFPTGAGQIDYLSNILARGLIPTMIAAGVCDLVKDDANNVVLDKRGRPVRRARYTGMHALRHFFASWCINRKIDGGLELPAKVVQERLGHSSINMTLDVYSHLFPAGDDGDALAAAAAQLLG